jgi:hypothetical protein
VFWVISVYFNLGNILPKSGTFPPVHPVYVCVCVYIYIYENIDDSDGVAIYDKFMSLRDF